MEWLTQALKVKTGDQRKGPTIKPLTAIEGREMQMVVNKKKKKILCTVQLQRIFRESSHLQDTPSCWCLQVNVRMSLSSKAEERQGWQATEV